MGIFRFRRAKDLASNFTHIYRTNGWRGRESVSGRGSDSDQTEELKIQLPIILTNLRVESLLDLPCGDLNWMKEVDLGPTSYTGADIVPDLIADLQERFQGSGRRFVCLDATRQNPGRFDAIFCRDMLVHLSREDITRCLTNFKKSGSKYLLTTHFTADRSYEELNAIGWRPINLTLPPFSFPAPIQILNEACTEGDGAFADKTISVWRLDELEI